MRSARVDTIPATLRHLPQWVLWRRVEREGKPTKVPFTPAGTPASVSDPNTWTDFETALEAYRRGGFDGIGFVLTADAGVVCVDIDHAKNGTDWTPEAMEMVGALNSYTEVSPSGQGLHIWCYGHLPAGRRRKNGVEMYDSGRFITVTGNHLAGTPDDLMERTAELADLHRRIFGETTLNLSDEVLIQRAMTARDGAKFRALWNGDTTGYPSQSEADLALCRLLAFWCGNDPARIERLFSQSALGQREKWQTREDYRHETIQTALQSLRETYSGQDTAPVVPTPAPRRAVSLRDLMAQEFAPLTYLVPDILPEGGLCLLVGRPKVGKSWFALQVACALSAGGWTLGLEQRLPKRRVLYCALEDGLRRIQGRVRLLGTNYDPDAFHVVTELSAMDRGGLEELRELIRQTQAQVVFVDVVARILPRRKRSEAVYQSDYDAFALLKDLAVAEGVTIVAVHHENKNPSTDPLDRVSGSTGVTGAIDAVLSLSKKRGEQAGTLFVTGRDIEKEAEYAITFTAGKWYVEGDAREVQMSEERREILRAIEELGGKAKPTEIAQVLGKTSGAVRFLLHKMVTAGELQRLNGYYTNTANTANTANACIPPTNANTQEGVSTVSSVSTVSTVSSVSSVSSVTTVTPITQSECLSNSETAPESVQSRPARDASEDWCWVPPKRKGLQWLVSTGEDSTPNTTPVGYAVRAIEAVLAGGKRMSRLDLYRATGLAPTVFKEAFEHMVATGQLVADKGDYLLVEVAT